MTANPKQLSAAEQRRLDFLDGFDAGRYADAPHRTVFGSPAYRKGHAYGVQSAVERRQQAVEDGGGAERSRQRGHMWRAVIRGMIIGALLGLLLAIAGKVLAAPLDDWRALNEECQGGSGLRSDKACTQRAKETAKLTAAGWYQGAHGVWVSPEHVAAFFQVLRFYDAQGRANPGELHTITMAVIDELRRRVPDEAIFALWNDRAGELMTHLPYAASMLRYGLEYLERTLSGRNDPRFRLTSRS